MSVVASGKINKDYRDEWQLMIDKVEAVDTVKEKYARSFEVLLNQIHQRLFEQLSALLKQNQGQCPVKFRYQVDSTQGSIITQDYFVKPAQQLIDAVDALLGDRVSKINYS